MSSGLGAFNANGGVLSMLGSALLGMLNQDKNTPRSQSTRKPRPKTRSQTKQKTEERPKAWEGWDKHKDWQYNADAAARDDAARANEDVQEAVQKVAGFVQSALGSGWWETVKKAAEGSGLLGTARDGAPEGAQSQRKKQDAKGRGSSR